MRTSFISELEDCKDDTFPERFRERLTKLPSLGLTDFIDTWKPNFRNYFEARETFIAALKQDDSILCPLKKSEDFAKFELQSFRDGWQPNFANYKSPED